MDFEKIQMGYMIGEMVLHDELDAVFQVSFKGPSFNPHQYSSGKRGIIVVLEL